MLTLVEPDGGGAGVAAGLLNEAETRHERNMGRGTLEGPLDDASHRGLDLLPVNLIVQLFNDVLEPSYKA